MDLTIIKKDIDSLEKQGMDVLMNEVKIAKSIAKKARKLHDYHASKYNNGSLFTHVVVHGPESWEEYTVDIGRKLVVEALTKKLIDLHAYLHNLRMAIKRAEP